MLFKETFKALIRDGSVTMTFRAWKAAKVVVGNSYRLGPDDAIGVKAVEGVTVGSRREDASASALEEVEARLERIDRLSRRGPWTNGALQLIAEHPKVAASRLAPRMQRETRAFKADIRKLKELGLTVSHEVGYSLSSRGRALFRRLRR